MMALIVENGLGLADAESYISVADADAYHSNRGNTAWAALTTTTKEQLLRKATDYMEQVYRLRWLGYRHTETQALSFPRDEVPRKDFTYLNQFSFYPNDTVPIEIKNSCAELASRAINSDLAPDIARIAKREKVDVLEVEYDANSPAYVIFRAIDNIVAPFLSTSGNSQRRVVRT
jgi:hypothetical protein